MASDGEEHSDISSSVLHWNYRNLKQFPTGILTSTHRCSKVKDLYLKENLLTSLPSDIAVLDRLESLYLSGNEIRCIPKEIRRLQRLQSLDLSGNRLTELPEEMGELSSLKYLVLDDNELQALPLRLADLRGLRYLSVCDNRLSWLPQRPVYNLQHCELRVWRNPSLCSLPYSLWYHMFRGQQIRSLYIGCCGVTTSSTRSGCVLKMHSDAAEWEIEIPLPGPYHRVMPASLLDNASPPPLLELCKREMYRRLHDGARRNSEKIFDSVYSAGIYIRDENSEENIICNETDIVVADINNNDSVLPKNNEQFDYDDNMKHKNGTSEPAEMKPCNCKLTNGKTPSELVEKYLPFLPLGLKQDMKNGPPSRCENVPCRRPIFDYAYLQFCTGSLLLIDSSPCCVLSAAFCSRRCALQWTRLKTVTVVPWQNSTFL